MEADSADTIEALKQRLVDDPDDETAWLQLGSLYLYIDHLPEALSSLATAVQLDGDVLAARRFYARALSRARRHDEAAFQLLRAQRLAPDNAAVAHQLGLAFYDKRLFDKAVRELSRARELAPADGRVSFALGLAHEGKGRLAEAIVAYREAVQHAPDLIEARRTLADALATAGELAEAVTELEAALRIDRTNTQLAANIDILRAALRELASSRLLGKGQAELERSMLVRRGQLERIDVITRTGELDLVRYRGAQVELWVSVDQDGLALRLMLLLRDPPRAAGAPDDAFEVTVVSQDGHHEPTNYATAVTLTFLREALGCPLTVASELYARLLRSKSPLSWGGAHLNFAQETRYGEPRSGLVVSV